MNFLQTCTISIARKSVLTLSLTLALPVAIAQATSTSPASAAATATAGSPILARGLAGVVVSASDVLSEMRRAPQAEQKTFLANTDAVEKLVNNLLVRRQLAAEAIRDGLNKDPVTAATAAIALDRALSDARLAKLDAQNTPSDAALEAEARTIYKDNEANFIRPPQTRASHILLSSTAPDSLQKAKDLLAKLRAGASFEELAKANSTDAGSAVRGGDLGYFSAGSMVQPFEDALKALIKPGDLSEPVESQFGYHIIRLEDRRDKGLQPFEEVRDQIMAEGRTAILNESRVQKVKSINKDIVFDKAAIEAFTKAGK